MKVAWYYQTEQSKRVPGFTEVKVKEQRQGNKTQLNAVTDYKSGVSRRPVSLLKGAGVADQRKFRSRSSRKDKTQDWNY